MPTHKITPQYGTLDVLLMYLLGYKQEVARIRKKVFENHSFWLSKQSLRCVRIQEETDKAGEKWIVLTRTNQQALQTHLAQFFIAYNNNTVKTPYRKLIWQEWDWFLQKLFNRHFLTQRRLTFSFGSNGGILPYGSDTCAFHCMANTVYCSLHHDVDSVRGLSLDAKTDSAYVTYKTTYQQGLHIKVALFGEMLCGWRTRVGVRWAFYKKHHIQFHSPLNKQKRLLDMLLEFDLEVPIEHAANELKITGTKEDIKASLYDLGSKIRKKALDACRGTKDTVDFEISVAGDNVRMVGTIP